MSFVFIGSIGKLEPPLHSDGSQFTPLPREPFVTLCWDLQMTSSAQALLFKRVRCTFDRVTGLVAMQSKKKYRMQPDELLRTRNLVVLFDQLLGHLRAMLPDEEVDQWIEEVCCGIGKDEDLQNIINLRPDSFSMSMLLSEQDRSQKDFARERGRGH